MHPAQHAVIERLGTERDAVDAGGAPGDGTVGRHVFRIGLERHFDGIADYGLRIADRRQESAEGLGRDRKSTRLNSSHSQISYAVFCLKKKKKTEIAMRHISK